jgi:hypothetical protein
MRLQLIIVAGLATGTAYADTSFDSKLQVYVDNDHTTVVSPLIKAVADVTDTTSVNAGYVADVVTSASIDIVTQASKTTIHDVRHQVSAGGARILGPYTLTGEYLYSTENDYRSHNVALGIERRLFENNTTLSLSYGLSLDTVMRSGDTNFHRGLTDNEAAFTFTQILSPKLIVMAGYTFGYADGFQSSPYRFVPVRMDPSQAPLFWVPETDPEQRFKHAFVVGANLHVFEDSAIQADYRFYADTWGIQSHTIQLRYLVNLTPNLELRFRERFYTQIGSTFYEPNYTQAEQYMTIDRELSALWSETIGVKLSWRLHTDVEAELKVDGFYYRYPDFPLLPSRTGANAGIGLSVSY